MEYIRLRLGKRGNKNEDISNLSLFFSLTIFPQAASVIYLNLLEPFVLPVERLLGMIHIIFLASQLMFGFQTLMKMISYKSQETQWIAEMNLN